MASVNNLHNVSTESIRRELEQIVNDTAEWMQRAAELLVELRRRKEPHPLMHSNTLRHFKLIGSKTLHPAAALAVGGNRNLVRALSRLPYEDQLAFATERTVQVVETTPEGKQIVEERHITHLSQPALDRVFSNNGLRSIEEQKAALGAPPNRKRIDGMLVDLDEKALIFARKHIRPNKLIAPLKELGYELRFVGQQAEK